MVVVVLFAGSNAIALTQYKDGGTHDIITTINDDVWVDWEAPGRGTTVNMLSSDLIDLFKKAAESCREKTKI